MRMYLSLLALLIILSCEDQDSPEIHRGDVVGYIKCYSSDFDDILVGFFLVTENEDSLLSFNIPISITGLDTSTVENGTAFYDGGSFEFRDKYMEANERRKFSCPPFIEPPFPPFFFEMENFDQVLMEGLNKIK